MRLRNVSVAVTAAVLVVGVLVWGYRALRGLPSVAADAINESERGPAA